MANDNNNANNNNLPSDEVVDSVLGSPDDFFAALDSEFNGAMQDQPAETIVDETSTQYDPQVTQNSDPNGNADSETDWKKRYGDSTRENQELSNFKKETEPFVPLIDAMKSDPKLVETVQTYLQNGGETPKSLQEQLGLDDTFVFDMNEAMSTPDSDSAKVLNQMVNATVERRVAQAVDNEKSKVTENRRVAQLNQERDEFMKNHNMSTEQFKDFNDRINKHVMTFEDMYLILNRDRATQNMAQNTRNAYAQQVESVRSRPQTASGTNSNGSSVKSEDDAIFDSLLGSGGTDNLFG